MLRAVAVLVVPRVTASNHNKYHVKIKEKQSSEVQ